ncbi:MAG: phosphatidate cytidylyltransferase, partial [Acidimicrobiia bacterium]
MTEDGDIRPRPTGDEEGRPARLPGLEETPPDERDERDDRDDRGDGPQPDTGEGSGPEPRVPFDQDAGAGATRRSRPWERPAPLDDRDLTGLAEEASPLDDFTDEHYRQATTEEYRGLAEAIAEASGQEHERLAVAATMPGVGSGLLGFEDVTGQEAVSAAEAESEELARVSDLTLRVGSAFVLLVLFLGSLLAGGWWFTTFVGAVMVVSLGEFYSTIRLHGYQPLALFGFLGLIGAAVGAHLGGPAAIAGFVLATAVCLALFYSLAVRRNPLENAALTLSGVAWMALLAFAPVIGRSERAVPLVLALVIVAAGFDTGAYLVGRSLGRRPLAPRLSPAKTVEGLVGGVATAFMLGSLLAVIPFFRPLDLAGGLLLAGMVSLLGPLGDAVESMVKRALGAKDMGSILPGHGGMLDRIDALLFVVPGAYFLF